MKNNFIELSETEFYNIDTKKTTGIFYHKDIHNRYFCIVLLPNKCVRNIWNIEKFAFEWMNKFEKYFTLNCNKTKLITKHLLKKKIVY